MSVKIQVFKAKYALTSVKQCLEYCFYPFGVNVTVTIVPACAGDTAVAACLYTRSWQPAITAVSSKSVSLYLTLSLLNHLFSLSPAPGILQAPIAPQGMPDKMSSSLYQAPSSLMLKCPSSSPLIVISA